MSREGARVAVTFSRKTTVLFKDKFHFEEKVEIPVYHDEISDSSPFTFRYSFRRVGADEV